MPFKTLIFAGLFVFCAVGALFNPLIGILGYVGHYMIGPERQWWERPIQHYGIRYSYVLALATFAGILFSIRKLRYGEKFLSGQEKLLLLFLGIIWAVTLYTPDTVHRYTSVDHPSIKFVKVVIFLLMLTHIVTDIKKFNALLWVFVIAALILGLQAYDTPRRAFVHGRLNSIGGADFAESNFFAAYMAGMLMIIAVQFMRSGWFGKLLCTVAGIFTANAIVLTRSRGAVVGLLVGGVAALIMSPRKHRLKIGAGLIIVGLGVYQLSDPQFRARASTIAQGEKQRDESAESRIRLARAGVKMVMNHPLGVGVGNFYQNIGHYIPEYKGKDAHNTYVRCMTETGIAGIVAFLAIIATGLLSLRRTIKRCKSLPDDSKDNIFYIAFGLCIAQITVLACCLTISLTYNEGLWWFLLLPTALGRVMDNYEADLLEAKKELPEESQDKEDRRRPWERSKPPERPRGRRLNPARI